MDNLNEYVILAGVLLIFGTLFWAGFTGLWSRLHSKRRDKRRRKTPASSRR